MAGEAEGEGLVFHPMDQFIVKPLFGEGPIQWYTPTNATLWMAVTILMVALFFVVGTGKRSIVPSRIQSIAELGYGFVKKMVEESSAAIKGGSQTNDQVSRFLRAVEASKDFKAPSLTSIAKDPATGGSSFEIAAEVQCPKPGEKVEDSLCAPPSKQAAQSIYKCRVNGTFTVQATPCEK